MKKPSILLFDEPTSALDSANESKIMKQLRQLAVDRPSITIAHRLSTILDADEILVLGGSGETKGQVVERGDHESLLAQRGLYYQLWLQQTQTQAQ